MSTDRNRQLIRRPLLPFLALCLALTTGTVTWGEEPGAPPHKR